MKKLILQLTLLLLACNGFAAFLRNVPVQLKQPDGRVIECFMTGDEYLRSDLMLKSARQVNLSPNTGAINNSLMDSTDPFLLDSLALVAIYNQCDGPNWARHDNWLTGPLHTWYGVTVGNNRVVELRLVNDIEHWGQPFGMRNSIPEEIGQLTELTVLDFYINDLGGSIPPEIGNLTKLKVLNLANCNLQGYIPKELKELTDLTHLYLDLNQLTGTIPEEIGYLKNLVNLSLMNNQLQGSIPSGIGNLTSLTTLYLMSNQLTGDIPAEIFALPALDNLSLGYNGLTGTIPPEFYQMQNIRSINLSNTKVTGRLTADIANLRKLEILELNEVGLEGEIPPELWELTNLRFLNLANCGVAGAISPEIGNMTNLGSLHLLGNQMTGSLPKEMGKLKELTMLSISDNQFSGDIPQELGGLTRLRIFSASNNQLSGSLPGGFAMLAELFDIDLANNHLENLPDLRSLQNLVNLRLTGNRLTFEDLENNVQIPFKPGGPGIIYSPQQRIGSPETKYALPGKPLTLSVYCGGTANQYQWFRNGQPVSGVQSVPEFTIASVAHNVNGIFLCRITNTKVPNLAIESAQVTVIGEDRLFADAGPDFSALEASVVKLDGTGSHHPGDGAITWLWTAPEGIALDSVNSPSPSFTAPEVKYPTRLVFVLTVSNEAGDTALDEIAITVNNDSLLNEAPVADAGMYQTAMKGTQIILDGSASFDPDDDILAYQWIVPPGFTLDEATKVSPLLTVPMVNKDSVYVISLIVDDGFGHADTAFVNVAVVIDFPPVADAGEDQMAYGNITWQLDGSKSYDPEGSPVTYWWTAPEGIVLSDRWDPRPTFMTPMPQLDSTLIFVLHVFDQGGKSDTAEVRITVKPLGFTCPLDASYDVEVSAGTSGPRFGQSITILRTGKLERIKLTISPVNSKDAYLLLRKWHSDTYAEAFDGEVIARSSTVILIPSYDDWQEMSTFVFPDSPELQGGEKYTIEVVNTLPYVVIPGAYQYGQAYETGNPDYDRDMRFAVYLCPDVNLPPMASVVGNMSVNEGTVVALDGTASSDPEGESLTYLWSAPDGIGLSTTTDATVTFTAPDVDQATTFSFTLVVSDGNGNSEPVEVAVTVLPVYQSEEDVILCFGETYHGWEITGSYSRTLETSAGFDSIVTTHLTVLAELSVELTFSGDTLGTAGTFVGYQWYRNGDPLAGATESRYIATMSGNYRVEVTDAHGCTAVSNEVYHVYSSVHALLGALPGYTVVPNPNGGQFAFRLRNPLPGDVWLTLVSPNGQMLEQHVLHPSYGPMEALFDVRHLSKGIYFLKVQTGQHMSTEKVVVGGE